MNSDLVLTLNALNSLTWPGTVVVVAGIAGLTLVVWTLVRH